MRVNLQDIYYIDSETQEISFKAINLYPYLIHAADIYVTCEETEKYKWLMTPSTVIDPNTNEMYQTPKMSISINGNIYPIAPGEPGESPTNPITYTKGSYKINLVGVNGSVGYIGTPPSGYIEETIEKDENIGGRNIGTNIMADNDNLVVEIIINDPSLIVSEKFPFGGAKVVDEVVTESYDGFGGAVNDDGLITSVEGFGGVPPNKYLEDIIIVIEKSQFVDDLNNRDIGPGVQNYGIRY